MVNGLSWFGAALLPQGMESSLSSKEKCIPKFIKTFCRRMLAYLSANWSSTKVGWCNRTTTQNKSKSTTEWLEQKKIILLVRVLTSTRLRCCGMTSSAVHTRYPKNIAELKQFCKEEWSKIHPDRCAGLIRNYRNRLVEVIAAKGWSTNY